MRVVLLNNAVSDEAPAADRDVLVQRGAVADALREKGHEPIALPVTLDLETMRRDLRKIAPDAVFNLVESLGGSDRLMFLATAVLDVLRIPYTGAPTEAILATGDKLRAKQRMRRAGLPTPDWVDQGALAEAAVPEAAFRRLAAARFVLKANWEHASFGLDAEALVGIADRQGLQEALDRCAHRVGGPCFAEEYIDGREFNLSILAGGEGPEVLPAAEIDFSAFPDGMPRLVDHRAKWDEDSFAYQNTPRRFRFRPSDRPLLDELRHLALSCWDVFALRGYARVDFRVDAWGRPWILEINANPCLSPDAGFAAALAEAGIPYAEAVERILRDTGE